MRRSISRSATRSRVSGRLRVPAAGQGLEAGQQLGEGEGLDQVVVAPAPQALHPVVHLAEGAEDEDRGPAPGVARGLDDGQPVDAREHAVHDHHVVLALEGQEQAFLALAGLLHEVSALGETPGHEGAGLGIVFDRAGRAWPRDLEDVRASRV